MKPRSAGHLHGVRRAWRVTSSVKVRWPGFAEPKTRRRARALPRGGVYRCAQSKTADKGSCSDSFPQRGSLQKVGAGGTAMVCEKKGNAGGRNAVRRLDAGRRRMAPYYLGAKGGKT